MSLLKLGPDVSDITGKYGGVYFHRDKYGLHCSKNPRQVNQRTPAQMAQRKAFYSSMHPLLPFLRFSNRGDPENPDWIHWWLTKDGQWHTLDCSSIVPAGAVAILFNIEAASLLAAKAFSLRKKGNVNVYNNSVLRTQIGRSPINAELLCFCDTERKVEYMTSLAVWLVIDLTIMGWWLVL